MHKQMQIYFIVAPVFYKNLNLIIYIRKQVVALLEHLFLICVCFELLNLHFVKGKKISEIFLNFFSSKFLSLTCVHRRLNRQCFTAVHFFGSLKGVFFV